VNVRLLTDDDAEHVGRLSQLTYGWLGGDLPTGLDGQVYVGVDGPDGRLHAMARLRSYEQFWGGRAVPMGGIAAVAVHPDARGRGLARAMMRALLGLMVEVGQPVSSLFPTAAGIYRPVGWEVVGSQDSTVLLTSLLARARSLDTGAVTVRAAGSGDVAAVAAMYDERGVATNGLLRRGGPEFLEGPQAVLEHDVVALAEDEHGEPAGYATYSRGRGYRADSQLKVWELVARTGGAAAALTRSIGSWDSVAPTVSWRGPTDELARLLPSALPAATVVQPWMLRVVDAPAAVAARGYAADGEASFELIDADVPANAGAWHLTVRDGVGALGRTAQTGLPRLHVQGLSLLYAGGCDVSGLLRAGLLDQSLAGLGPAFAGAKPEIFDYF